MNKKLLGTLVLSFMLFGSINSRINNSGLEVKDVLAHNLNEVDGRTVTIRKSQELTRTVADEVKIQQRKNENGTYTIRFVAGISSVELEKVTFNVTINNGEKSATKSYDTSVAYTSIKVGEDILTATDIFGENYNYLVAYAISGIPSSAIEYTYSCNVDIYSLNSEVLDSSNTRTTSLKSIADVDNPVVLDGRMDDVLWTNTVKEHKVSGAHISGKTSVEFYTTRNHKGVYIYGTYFTKNPYDQTEGVEWYQTDNIEFRITTPDHTRPLDGDREQFIISALNGGTHNATDGYVSPITLNPTTSNYEMNFELFIDYNHDKLNASTKINALTPLGFHWGSAPRDGWFACSYWYNDGAFNLSHKISYYDETVCTEHHYSDYTIVLNPTIEKEGLQAATCYVCNHYDTKPIAKLANLVTNPETLNSPWWSMLHRYSVDGSKAWTMKFVFNSTRNEGTSAWGDQFVAGIFEKGTTTGWDFRSDWCGGNAWGSGASYTDVNGLGRWPNYFEASKNMNITMLVSFEPANNTVTFNMTYASLSVTGLPVIENVVAKNTNITYRGNMDVALGVQNGTITLTEAYLLEGSLA